tara:strand:+ start:1270 stop:2064 length:795 start_codon:yes stop_codon:yes gene_type:complete
MFNLSDKVILVTGGTGLLGKTYCEELAKNDAIVIMADLKETNPKKIAEEFYTSKSYQIYGMEVDVSSEKQIIDLMHKIRKKFGKLDVLINNAAVTGEHLLREGEVFTSFEESSLQIWEKSLKVNLTGVYLSTREAGKLMLDNGKGCIINISSIYGVVGPDHSIYKNMPFNSICSYAASKAGIHGLTRWLATYWGDKSIRVNTVVLGGVENKHDVEFVKLYSERTPLKRMANPKDMIGIILYLASDLSKYATGQQFFVDGGWTAI